MYPTLTVVIPALNEAEHLPVLLDLLEAQSVRPDAVIVADAGSTDGTREIATARGARVVQGGKPAAGRNAGALAAKTDLILFLDADDEPEQGWIELALAEFEERGLSVAAGQVEPIERDPQNLVACEVVNLYLQLMQYVAPHAPGFCILVRRDVHERIGGFDESVVLAEDHEYVQRAAEVGKFRVLRSAPMRTSMRRIEKEGLVGLAFKYLYCELYAVTGTPIRKVPFEYEFAAFGEKPGERELALVDFDELRAQFERLREPLATLPGELVDRLRALGDTDIGIDRLEQRLKDMAPDEVRQLREYVERRIRVARRMPPIVLKRMRRAGDRAWKRLTDSSA